MHKGLLWIFRKIGINSKKQEYKQRVMDETVNVDFTAITHDWEKAKQLYDILKKRCHPDLYSGQQSEEATRIFQAIMQNKYSYTELLKLKQEAEEKLGISM